MSAIVWYSFVAATNATTTAGASVKVVIHVNTTHSLYDLLYTNVWQCLQLFKHAHMCHTINRIETVCPSVCPCVCHIHWVFDSDNLSVIMRSEKFSSPIFPFSAFCLPCPFARFPQAFPTKSVTSTSPFLCSELHPPSAFDPLVQSQWCHRLF